MPPVPQENAAFGKQDPKPEEKTLEDDAVVISGMSALLPECHNLEEFNEKLYNKENMVKIQKPRWKYSHPELPEHLGKIPDLNKFDAQFFMVHYRLGNAMDAMSRKLLEQAYQAIFDAGVCPTELSGKKVGVFIASCFSETEKVCCYTEVTLGILGSNRAMYANRISYWLNVRGPSIVIDSSCCSSMVALEKAYQALMHGECEAAIVGGCKIMLHPQSYVHYKRLVPINPDGKTKCYDMDCDGQSKSEAINVLFLQRHKDAKRVYASVCYTKVQFHQPHQNQDMTFGPYRDTKVLVELLKEFYEEARIPPSLVEYVEGCGSAIAYADKSELQAVGQVFCNNRSSPLLVGSVCSNVGYTESSSTTTSIIKVLLAYKKGLIAANINCNNPRSDIKAITDGNMKIVTDHHSFNRSYAAVNSLSVTGLNGHALLKGHYKKKDFSKYHSEVPYLVTLSGRQESAVQKIIDFLKTGPMDPEEIALLHSIHKIRISGHLARGYGIFNNGEKHAETIAQKVDYYDDVRRPLWFVYSGMGSQWNGMGTHLLKIPIFAAAIERCQNVLKPKGVDVIHIITSDDKEMFENILNSFVGIAAIQIGLTDVLRSIGIVPDKIIGHSVGELGCAYADGCFTAEEMILSAYSRGLVSIQTSLIRGSMAAVGLGYQKIAKLCPPEIEVACHNGPDSSTISGPADIMKQFVQELTVQGIFAKEVNCSNIAYHSRYIADAGPGLMNLLTEVIKSPKPRSSRWVSTSVPIEKWNEISAKHSSAEYHTNNLLSPVLFEETSKLVPSNAVLIEIAPHGLLQAILKRSLPSNCCNVPLTRKGYHDNSLFFLDAIGKLYIEGYDVDVSALYPQINFPVSTETRSLSHIVEWVHSERWNTCCYVSADRTYSAVYKPIVTIFDDEYQFLSGHIINGLRVFPFSAALVLIWDTLAMTIEEPRREVSVEFREVHLYVQPVIHEQRPLRLSISIQRGSGRFEVSYEHGMIADGFIEPLKSSYSNPLTYENHFMELQSDDIYKLLFEKGYEYRDEFRSIHNANLSLENGEIEWNGNWVTFIDGMIQLYTLQQNHKNVSNPNYINKIKIDVKKHIKEVTNNTNIGLVEIFVDKIQNRVRCGGIVIEHITFKNKLQPLQLQPRLKEFKFVPFYDKNIYEEDSAIYVYMQIVAETICKNQLAVCVINTLNREFAIDRILALLKSPPAIDINIEYFKKVSAIDFIEYKPDLTIIFDDIVTNKSILDFLIHHLPSDTFVVTFGSKTNVIPSSKYKRVCSFGPDDNKIELAKWIPSSELLTAVTVSVNSKPDFNNLISVRSKLQADQRLVILVKHHIASELRDLVRQWRSESDRNNINVVINDSESFDKNIPDFDLAYNVLNNKIWGGQYYLPLVTNIEKEKVAALRSAYPGDLNALQWLEVANLDETQSDIIVNVHCAGVNALDAKRAIGEIAMKSDLGYGMDYSGTTENDTRVMGLISNGSACGWIKALPEFLWPIPNHWNLEDAATVPLPYAHAFYCLMIKCKLVRGMNLFIHGGAGGLGQAVISIALANGCRVFTTVCDSQKKKLLRKLFPELPAENIGNSRDSTFGDMVLHATKGDGCHIIISCVKGDLKNATLHCCAHSGSTLDTTQIYSQENFNYGMFYMTKSRSYIPIDFSSIFHNKKYTEMKSLQLMISEGIVKGYVRPLTYVSYFPHEAPHAMRLLAASRHHGRVLLKIKSATNISLPRLMCTSNNCQVIICDEDSIAVQLTDKLITRGSKNLIIVCSKPTSFVNFKKKVWNNLGVNSLVITKNLKNKVEVAELLTKANDIGPVEGIYTMCGEDAKIILKNLDTESRQTCTTLKNFVIVSEDIFSDDFIYQRSKLGLPIICLQLRDVEKFFKLGVSENKNKTENRLKISDVVDAIEIAVCSKKTRVVAYAEANVKPSLIDEISKIPGVSINRTILGRTKLEQVGIDLGRAQEVCSILEERFNVFVNPDVIPQMTVSMIKRLVEEPLSNLRTEESGVAPYFKYVDPDEMLASTDMVAMPTLIHNSEMRSDELDPNQDYLCIVPGVESHHNRFFALCERLKIAAVVLQPGLDKIDETVPEIAKRLVDVMMNKLKLKKHFYLLGYELGIAIVTEMTAILESYGLTGTIYYLGGTPEDIRTTTGQRLNMSEEEIQNSLIQHLHYQFSGINSVDLDDKLEENVRWEEKVDFCVKVLLGKVPYTIQYMKAIIQAAYSRILLAKTYIPKARKLRSRIIVLKALLPFKSETNILKKISTQRVAVHELKATLSNAPNDLRCAPIINGYLNAEILETFDKRNHCETYLLNDDLYMKFGADDD